MSGFNLADYVDVAERIRLFYEKYPDGRLLTVEHGKYELGGREFVYCKASAYRTPEDVRPCNGIAWEPFPGPTPYTKDSELMNAETSAWGRAIIAAGIPSKKIASRDEVENRSGATGARADSRAGSTKKRPKHLAKLEDYIKVLNEKAPREGGESWKAHYAEFAKEHFGGLPSELTDSQLETVLDDAAKQVAYLESDVPF